jgi:hypothetical protein
MISMNSSHLLQYYYNILEKYHRCMKDGQYHDLIKTYPTYTFMYIDAKRQTHDK